MVLTDTVAFYEVAQLDSELLEGTGRHYARRRTYNRDWRDYSDGKL